MTTFSTTDLQAIQEATEVMAKATQRIDDLEAERDALCDVIENMTGLLKEKNAKIKELEDLLKKALS